MRSKRGSVLFEAALGLFEGFELVGFELHEHVPSMVLHDGAHELFVAVEGIAPDPFVLEFSGFDLVDELFHQGLFLTVATGGELGHGGAVARIHEGDKGGEVFADDLAVDGEQTGHFAVLAFMPVVEREKSSIKIQ